MIVRRSQSVAESKHSESFGFVETVRYSDAGGLTQFGVSVQTLQPGARSSERHWHEHEDEFLYALVGEVTVTENDGAHVLQAGDAACWPAGVANAHHVSNRSDSPCSYVILGTRQNVDICHYPDVRTTLYSEGKTWRLVDSDGNIIKSGSV